MNEQESRISAAPNESLIRGRILEIAALPEGQGIVWKVRISESKDISDLPNFTRSLIGETISIYVDSDFTKKFRKFDTIEARVKFEGDTLNSAFFLAQNVAHHIPPADN